MRYLIITLIWISVAVAAVDEAGYGVISYDDFQVKNVSIGDSYYKVISKFGKPLEEKRINSQPELDVGETIKLCYPGLYISLFEGEVGEIVISTSDFDVKGIRIGSTSGDAVAQIGNANPITINNRTSLRYRCVAKNGVITDAELRLFLEKDKISEISLWFPTT